MKLDEVIDTVRNAVPECLAAGAVDLATGMLLAVRVDGDRSGSELDLLASSAEMLFQGSRLPQLAQAFSEGEATLQDVVVLSDGAAFIFQRCRRRPGIAVVTVSRASANLGMVLARARHALASVEAVLVASLSP